MLKVTGVDEPFSRKTSCLCSRPCSRLLARLSTGGMICAAYGSHMPASCTRKGRCRITGLATLASAFAEMRWPPGDEQPPMRRSATSAARRGTGAAKLKSSRSVECAARVPSDGVTVKDVLAVQRAVSSESPAAAAKSSSSSSATAAAALRALHAAEKHLGSASPKLEKTWLHDADEHGARGDTRGSGLGWTAHVKSRSRAELFATVTECVCELPGCTGSKITVATVELLPGAVRADAVFPTNAS
mmetsp:Transcript_9101/g.23391  ORF Transcript_9101/g.23391 Transcript_9101/m.23391 type:complete len:245 (+) Transcript_9101:1155-1889(+)